MIPFALPNSNRTVIAAGARRGGPAPVGQANPPPVCNPLPVEQVNPHATVRRRRSSTLPTCIGWGSPAAHHQPIPFRHSARSEAKTRNPHTAWILRPATSRRMTRLTAPRGMTFPVYDAKLFHTVIASIAKQSRGRLAVSRRRTPTKVMPLTVGVRKLTPTYACEELAAPATACTCRDDGPLRVGQCKWDHRTGRKGSRGSGRRPSRK